MGEICGTSSAPSTERRGANIFGLDMAKFCIKFGSYSGTRRNYDFLKTQLGRFTIKTLTIILCAAENRRELSTDFRADSTVLKVMNSSYAGRQFLSCMHRETEDLWAASFAIPVAECAGIFLYMAFVMFLKRAAYLRLEKPLVVRSVKKLHIHRAFLPLENHDNLHLIGTCPILMQVFPQAADRVRKTGIVFTAPFNNANSCFISI